MPPKDDQVISKRYKDGFTKRLNLVTKLREIVTEEDVESFYLKLMKMVQDGDRDAMKMFLKVVHPEKEVLEAETKKPALPELSPEAQRCMQQIYNRYVMASRRVVVDQALPALKGGEDGVHERAEPESGGTIQEGDLKPDFPPDSTQPGGAEAA